MPVAGTVDADTSRIVHIMGGSQLYDLPYRLRDVGVSQKQERVLVYVFAIVRFLF